MIADVVERSCGERAVRSWSKPQAAKGPEGEIDFSHYGVVADPPLFVGLDWSQKEHIGQ